jgi:hypothetical protein
MAMRFEDVRDSRVEVLTLVASTIAMFHQPV